MKLQRRLSLLLALLLGLALLSVTALAAGAPEPERPVSLTLRYSYEELPIPGAWFRLYRVAALDASGSLTRTPSFAAYPIDEDALRGGDWQELAQTLAGYAARDQLPPDASGQTDETGTLELGERLPTGLYLLVGSRKTLGSRVYTPAPALLLLPEKDPETQQWRYDVTLAPKCSASDAPGGSDTVTRRVLKLWQDDGAEAQRPDQIRVSLLRDGLVYETVTLRRENNWRHTWEKLEASHDWQVVEQELPGYTVKLTVSGNSFLLTNTASAPPRPKPPAEPSLPQTGQLWWPVPVLLLGGLTLLLLSCLPRRGSGRRSGKHE